MLVYLSNVYFTENASDMLYKKTQKLRETLDGKPKNFFGIFGNFGLFPSFKKGKKGIQAFCGATILCKVQNEANVHVSFLIEVCSIGIANIMLKLVNFQSTPIDSCLQCCMVIYGYKCQRERERERERERASEKEPERAHKRSVVTVSICIHANRLQFRIL